MERKLIAYSHGRKYSYWLATDRYVYQRNEVTGAECGWLCAESSWEVFARSMEVVYK